MSMVTDAVPELMSKREGRLLSLGLRARVGVLKCVDPPYIYYKCLDKWLSESVTWKL